MLAYGGNGPLHCLRHRAHLGSTRSWRRRTARCSRRSARATCISCTSTSARVPVHAIRRDGPRAVLRLRRVQRHRRRTRGQGPRRPAASGHCAAESVSTGSSSTCVTAISSSRRRWSSTDPARERGRRDGADRACSADDYGRRFGEGSESPEAGHPDHHHPRRLAIVEGETVRVRCIAARTASPRRPRGRFAAVPLRRHSRPRSIPRCSTRRRSSRASSCPARQWSPRPPRPTWSSPAGI